MIPVIKKLIKRFFNFLNLELNNKNAYHSNSLQLVTAMKQCKIDTVFDVGANIGQFAEELRMNGYNGKIVSFEPLYSEWEFINYKSANDLNWIIHERTAIGDHKGSIKINVSKNSVSSSLLNMLPQHELSEPNSRFVDSQLVNIDLLDNIYTEYFNPVNNSLFIKIDTQGYESQVLDGAINLLPFVKGIVCELSLTPLYEGQLLWVDIITKIQNFGFTLWSIQKGFTDLESGRTLQIDAIFIRQ